MEETVSSSSDDDEAGSSGSKMPVLPPLPPVVSAGYSLLVARAPVSQQRVESTARRGGVASNAASCWRRMGVPAKTYVQQRL